MWVTLQVERARVQQGEERAIRARLRQAELRRTAVEQCGLAVLGISGEGGGGGLTGAIRAIQAQLNSIVTLVSVCGWVGPEGRPELHCQYTLPHATTACTTQHALSGLGMDTTSGAAFLALPQQLNHLPGCAVCHCRSSAQRGSCRLQAWLLPSRAAWMRRMTWPLAAALVVVVTVRRRRVPC